MTVSRLLALPLIWLVRAYQLVISPMFPPSCRFYPSCSAYAVTALERALQRLEDPRCTQIRGASGLYWYPHIELSARCSGISSPGMIRPRTMATAPRRCIHASARSSLARSQWM